MTALGQAALLILEENTAQSPPPPGGAAMVQAWLPRLVQWAQDSGMPVVHALRRSRAGLDVAVTPAGPDDWVVEKPGLSAFHETGLEPWLRARHVDTVVVCGFLSHTACLATALDALTRGLGVTFLSDATLAADLPRADGSVMSAEEVQGAVLALVQANGAAVSTAEAAMSHRPGLRPAVPADEAEIRRILAAAHLPVANLGERLPAFLVADAGEIAGVVELTHLGSAALLRSLAVAPTWRRRGLGEILVEAALHQARMKGADTVYLLTSSAEAYFPRFGFRPLDRRDVPLDILASLELPGKYPGGGIIMIRELS